MLNFLCIPLLQAVLRCKLIVDALHEKVDWTMLQPTHSIGRETDIAFEMIGDNYTETLSQLDSIRMRKSRFICINDNMVNPSKEVKQALSDFFEALWPHPSPFELPEGQSNHLLRYDAILAERTRKQEQGFIASLQHDLSTLMTRIIATCGATLEVYISYAIKLILSYVLAASESFSEHLRALGAEESDPVDTETNVYHEKVLAHPYSDRMTNLELTTVSLVCLFTAVTIACLFRRSRRF